MHADNIEQNPGSTNLSELGIETLEKPILCEVMAKIESLLQANSALVQAVQATLEKPSKEMFSTIDELAATAKESVLPFLDSNFFAESDDETLVQASVSTVIDLTLETCSTAREITPGGVVFICEDDAKQQIIDVLLTGYTEDEDGDEDEEIDKSDVSVELCNNYAECIDDLVVSLLGSKPVVDFVEAAEKRADRAYEVRTRLLDVGTTAVGIALGLTLFEIAKRGLKRK